MSSSERSSSMGWRRTPIDRLLNRAFVWITGLFALGVAAVLGFIALRVGIDAWPAIQQFGLGFITSTRWDPVNNVYGAAPQLVGTLITSAIALLIAVPIGLGVAIFLTEDFLPPSVQQPVVFMVELLAAIPSVVYGLWAIFVLIPVLNKMGGWLHAYLGWIPLFSSQPVGPGIHVAGVILAIMILPIITAISRDALIAVPAELRQGAYGLGATRWETIFQVILPTAFSAIVGAVMLALGRAMGETMAVTMVIGNSSNLSWSLFDQGSTVSSLLANQFAEAGGLQISALMYAAILLFLLTLLVNILAEVLVRRISLKV